MDDKKLRQPLSSASEIMSRHDKKKRKWYKRVLKGDNKEEEIRKDPFSDKVISRSLENVGNLNLTVMGFPVKASSYSNVTKDGDDFSLSSISSNESDTSEHTSPEHQSLDRRKLNDRFRKISAQSTDSENSIDSPIWQDFNAGSIVDNVQSSSRAESSKDPGFSFYDYLPFTWSNPLRGSWESVCSQPEEKKALMHLVHESDSEQVIGNELKVLLNNFYSFYRAFEVGKNQCEFAFIC